MLETVGFSGRSNYVNGVKINPLAFRFLEYVNSNGGYKGCPFPSANPDNASVLETLQELELHTTDAYQPAAEEESQVQQHIEPEWRAEH